MYNSPLSSLLLVSISSAMNAREDGAMPVVDLRLADDGLFPDRGLLVLRSSSSPEAE